MLGDYLMSVAGARLALASLAVVRSDGVVAGLCLLLWCTGVLFVTLVLVLQSVFIVWLGLFLGGDIGPPGGEGCLALRFADWQVADIGIGRCHDREDVPLLAASWNGGMHVADGHTAIVIVCLAACA